MLKYNSLNRDTGVVAYQVADDGIYVEFRDGPVYLYTIKSAGTVAIEKMKSLAAEGKGLTTYINRYVKNRYEEKIK